MISHRSAQPPRLPAPLLPALSLLPALLGIGQEQPLQGLELPLAMMEVLAAAHARLQPRAFLLGWG